MYHMLKVQITFLSADLTFYKLGLGHSSGALVQEWSGMELHLLGYISNNKQITCMKNILALLLL